MAVAVLLLANASALATSVHDVAVWAISAPSSAEKGTVIPVYVTVANEGDYPETFNVTVSDVTDAALIGSQVVYLDSNATVNGSGSFKVLTFNYDTSYASLGNHTLKAEAGAVAFESDIADNVKTTYVAIVPPYVPPKMHVAAIEMAIERSRSSARAVAVVTAVDETGNAVEGATVSGRWSGLTTDSDVAQTDSAGRATVYSDWKKHAKGTFTFTVESLAKPGWEYDAPANAETSDSISTG